MINSVLKMLLYHTVQPQKYTVYCTETFQICKTLQCNHQILLYDKEANTKFYCMIKCNLQNVLYYTVEPLKLTV